MMLTDLFDLTGKTALVTGGSRGLGLQIAEGLAEQGAAVIITSRDQNNLDAAQTYLRNKNLFVEVISQDLFDDRADQKLLDKLIKLSCNRIDILVNNAGVSHSQPAEHHDSAAWDWIMSINIRAVFLLSQTIGAKYMIPQGYGRIINISSIAGLGGVDSTLPLLGYSSSKGALNSFTRSLAAEWGHHGITVNAIAPGFFPTDQTNDALATIDIDAMLDKIPLRRLGDSQDLKGAIALFSSDAGKHITGQILAVDGGTSSRLD